MRRLAAASLICAAVALEARAAHAQILDNVLPPDIPGLDTSPGTTVLTRVHPGFEQHSIPLGGAALTPTLDEGVGYESNVLGSNIAQGSPFLNTSPAVSLSKDWSRGSFVASGSLTNVDYFSLPTENYTNDTIALGGSYQMGRDTVSLAYAHLDVNVLPTGLNFIGITRPLPVHVDQFSIDDALRFARVTLDPNFSFTVSSFNNVVENGAYQNIAYLNRNDVAGGINAYYELAPQRNLILSLRTTGEIFGKTNPMGPKFDNHGVTALVGYRDNTGGIINWYALFGYQEQDFDYGYPKQSQPIGEAGLTWVPTGLTTVTASVKREIEETIQPDQIGYTYLTADARVDHEYLRNLILHGEFSYERASREEQEGNYLTFDTGGRWSVNRNLRIDLGVTYRHFTSNVGFNYDDVITTLGAHLGL